MPWVRKSLGLFFGAYLHQRKDLKLMVTRNDREAGMETPVAVGQTVEFKVTASYQLSIADKGSIILVIQDENNKNLLAGKPQISQSVDRGKGTVTLTQSFLVPMGRTEVRLFIPLVPKGLDHTDGELVMRYPVKRRLKRNMVGQLRRIQVVTR